MFDTMIAQANRYNSALATGEWVWCDFAETEARTAEGFCQFCGSTEHKAA